MIINYEKNLKKGKERGWNNQLSCINPEPNLLEYGMGRNQLE